MIKFYFHHDPNKLPVYSKGIHPVQIYNSYPWDRNNSSCIARSVVESVRDLGVKVTDEAFDFLTIAMAVTAADTFNCREDSDNAWSRNLKLHIPLINPILWQSVASDLQSLLGYLTGDHWKLTFSEGGLNTPTPKKSKLAITKANMLSNLDCVSLFSGGLDSAVGAIDLTSAQKTKPLLISHAYRGDSSKQTIIENLLIAGSFGRHSFNADPHIIESLEGKTDNTMRGRSFNFIAMAVIGLSAIRSASKKNQQTILIPENGYISLNPPLTRRRVGSLSTRTTHPHYLKKTQDILNQVGLNLIIVNPYQYKTKGEMVAECLDTTVLKKAISTTVSCSNWYRKGIQCGRCVPCIIRRSAISHAKLNRFDAAYDSEDLQAVMKAGDTKDDLFALIVAGIRLTASDNIDAWVRTSGPLPDSDTERVQLIDVFKRGLSEVSSFLHQEKII